MLLNANYGDGEDTFNLTAAMTFLLRMAIDDMDGFPDECWCRVDTFMSVICTFDKPIQKMRFRAYNSCRRLAYLCRGCGDPTVPRTRIPTGWKH